MDAKKEIKVLDVDFIISDLKKRIDYNQKQIDIQKDFILKSHLGNITVGGDSIQEAVGAIKEAAATNNAYKRILYLLEGIGAEYILDDNGNPSFEVKEIIFQKSLLKH